MGKGGLEGESRGKDMGVHTKLDPLLADGRRRSRDGVLLREGWAVEVIEEMEEVVEAVVEMEALVEALVEAVACM